MHSEKFLYHNLRKTLLYITISLKYIAIYFILFSFAVGVFYYLVTPLLNISDKILYIKVVGLITESAILTFISLLCFSFTRRVKLSFIVTLIFYLGFILSNLTKIEYLSTPIYPADLILLGDLLRTWEVFKEFILILISLTCLIIAILYYGIKLEKTNTISRKVAHLFTIYLIFASLTIFLFNSNISFGLRKLGILHMNNSNLIKRCLKYGFLTNFTQTALFLGRPRPPLNYSRKTINEIINLYALKNTAISTVSRPPENVIILLIESFTDPNDFGWQFSADPIPTFHSIINNHSSGYILSPVYGGKSINAEFELMTGLSNRYTPIESTPYKEYINKKIPSLARTFKDNGYITNAIQVIKFHGFGYGKIYDYIGVDNKISLSRRHDKSLEADPSHRSTSNREIAKKIIELTELQHSSFIFAFPNSSHSPWKLEHYPNSTLKLKNEIKNQTLKNRITAYANALSHGDLLLKLLIDNFKNISEKTIIIVLGDHQPGLRGYNMNIQNNTVPSEAYYNSIIKKHKVPIGIWSNYRITKDPKINISMNLLSSYILNISDIPTIGFMKLNELIRNQFSIVSLFIQQKNKNYTQKLPKDKEQILLDYQMLQYDILFGKHYLDELLKN